MDILLPVLVGLVILVVIGGAAMLVYAVASAGPRHMTNHETKEARQKKADDARYAREWEALRKRQ